MSIRQLRERKGWSQTRLADAMSIPQQRVSEYEHGQDMVASRAKKFAHVLGGTLEEVTDNIPAEK
ncbi:helix-turn-helix domain-containing protein [Bifidobacterium indicum]|uniref:helix-turn-helix domain-containing protein n=1 Tax=Bifidobacterium indicum TaxID=1691 RepID=UPI0030DCCFB3